MTADEYIKDKLRDLARSIDNQIPPEYGFVLLVLPFGEQGVLQYVANCDRLDAIQTMREFIQKTERTFGTHRGTGEDDEGHLIAFEKWYAQEKRRGHGSDKARSYDAFIAGMEHHSLLHPEN